MIWDKIAPYVSTFGISASASLARTLLMPHSGGFVRNLVNVFGGSLVGLLVGITCVHLVTPEWLTILVAVSAASAREFIEALVKQVHKSASDLTSLPSKILRK